jgi:hypothetical protein
MEKRTVRCQGETADMFPTVEVVGAPGIGKSALLEILETEASGSDWCTLSLAERQARQRSLLGKLKRRVALFAFGESPASATHPDILAARRFVAQHAEYAALCWERISLNRGPAAKHEDLRLLTARNFLDAFSRYQTIKESEYGGLTLLDEGLVQKITVLWHPDQSEAELHRVAYLTPKPAGIVHVTADPATVVDRLMRRDKVAYEHTGLTGQELHDACETTLESLSRICQTLENRGIPVMTLRNADGALRRLAREIGEWMTTLRRS